MTSSCVTVAFSYSWGKQLSRGGFPSRELISCSKSPMHWRLDTARSLLFFHLASDEMCEEFQKATLSRTPPRTQSSLDGATLSPCYSHHCVRAFPRLPEFICRGLLWTASCRQPPRAQLQSPSPTFSSCQAESCFCCTFGRTVESTTSTHRWGSDSVQFQGSIGCQLMLHLAWQFFDPTPFIVLM